MSARPRSQTREGPLRYLVGWLAWFGLLFALWLALIDNTPLDDIVNGLVCAAIGAGVAELVRAQRVVRVRFEPAWVTRLWRPLWRFFADTGLVLAALFRVLVLRKRVRGRFRAVRVRTSGPEPRRAGRRAFTEWAGSFAPNRYLIGVDGEHDVALVHELVTSDEPLDPLGDG